MAVADDDTETAEHLLRRADAAMYAAKTAGGSRVVRADAQADDAPVDLVGALSRRELRLHYQPVVSLLSGAVLGVTTVIKWRHPERGMLPATEVRAAIGAGASSLPVVHWAIDRAISDVRTVAPGRVEHVSVWIPIPGRAALAASTRTALATSFAGPDGTLTPESAPSIVLDVHEQDVASLTKRRAMHHHLDALLHEGPLALGVERFTADAVPVGTLQLLGAASVSIDPELLVEAAENEATEELVRSLVDRSDRARRHRDRDGRGVAGAARPRPCAGHPRGLRRPHRATRPARHLLRPAPRRPHVAARSSCRTRPGRTTDRTATDRTAHDRTAHDRTSRNRPRAPQLVAPTR